MLFSHWPIRNKLQLGLGLFAVSVLTLFGSAYYGLYAYRSLAKSLSVRSAELPLADKLRDDVADVHETLNQLDDRQSSGRHNRQFSERHGESETQLWLHYHAQLDIFCQALGSYREQLDSNHARTDLAISDDRDERQTLAEIDDSAQADRQHQLHSTRTRPTGCWTIKKRPPVAKRRRSPART